MRQFKVQISDSSLKQIQEQVDYIAQDSIDNALAWENRLLQTIRKLADFHGHATDEDARDRIGGMPHKLVFEGTYLIHYEVDDASCAVVIVNFRHGARRHRVGEP